MPLSRKPAFALVLRPYPGVTARHGAYAHIEGLIMRLHDEELPTMAGELRALPDIPWRHHPRLDGFRLTSQIDDRHADAYAVRYGYSPGLLDQPFTPQDLRSFGPSLKYLAQAMDELQAGDPRFLDIETIAVRLVRVLRVSSLVLLVPRLGHDSFGPTHPVLAASPADTLAPTLAALRQVQRDLHHHCVRRLTGAAA